MKLSRERQRKKEDEIEEGCFLKPRRVLEGEREMAIVSASASFSRGFIIFIIVFVERELPDHKRSLARGKLPPVCPYFFYSSYFIFLFLSFIVLADLPHPCLRIFTVRRLQNSLPLMVHFCIRD